MLRLADLAARADFTAGPLRVSPARRLVEGPAGRALVEPIVMKVFLLLLDRAGEVVTRDELLGSAWGGVFVGDDSLNRAITRVRKVAAETAPGVFEIETIPRTGYRMSGAVGDSVKPEPASARPELIERAAQLMRSAMPGSSAEAAALVRTAAEVDPSSSAAWGFLALACRNSVEEAEPSEVCGWVMDSEAAARRALALEPSEPNARLALATLRPEFGGWSATEDALRDILAESPDHLPTLYYLLMVLQAVGRAQESWELNERALELDPLAPVPLFRRALKLWTFGRVPEADLSIDRALQVWPNHPAVWNARLMLFAFTGRARAALDLIGDRRSRPPSFTEQAFRYWEASLRALDGGDDSLVDQAVAVNLELAPTNPYFTGAALMTLPMLHRLDEAYAVAEGSLLRRGALIGAIWAGKDAAAVYDLHWRRTMMLFTPAAATLRADARFAELCEGIGMTDYWRSRGIGPDPFFDIAPFWKS